MELGVATGWAYLLVLFRTSGLLAAAPIFSTSAIPVRVRMAVAALLAFAAFAGTTSVAPAVPESLAGLALAAAQEGLIGVAAGLAARMVFESAMAAGQAAGLTMGLGFASILDPVHGGASSAAGELLSLAALAAAVALGLHREAFAWLCRSTAEMPPGTTVDLAGLGGRVIAAAAGSFALAVRIAYPVLAAVTAGHLALAATSRLAHQLNLQSLGFSVAIIAGGGAFWLIAPAAGELAARAALQVLGG